MKKYIVLDSNTYVSFFEGGLSLSEPEGTLTSPEDLIVLNNLLKALNNNLLTLLLPSVVVLECERLKEKAKKDLDEIYASAKAKVQTAGIPNKLISVNSKDKINKTLESICLEEKAKVDKAWDLFNQIFKHKNTELIQLNGEIFFHAFERGLSGKKPHSIKYLVNHKPIFEVQPDSLIVESVHSYLADKNSFQLYLCTNDANFYTDSDKKHLDDGIKTDLKVDGHFLTLSNLLNKLLKFRPPKKAKIDKTPVVNAWPPANNLVSEGKIDTGSQLVSR